MHKIATKLFTSSVRAGLISVESLQAFSFSNHTGLPPSEKDIQKALERLQGASIITLDKKTIAKKLGENPEQVESILDNIPSTLDTKKQEEIEMLNKSSDEEKFAIIQKYKDNPDTQGHGKEKVFLLASKELIDNFPKKFKKKCATELNLEIDEFNNQRVLAERLESTIFLKEEFTVESPSSATKFRESLSAAVMFGESMSRLEGRLQAQILKEDGVNERISDAQILQSKLNSGDAKQEDFAEIVKIIRRRNTSIGHKILPSIEELPKLTEDIGRKEVDKHYEAIFMEAYKSNQENPSALIPLKLDKIIDNLDNLREPNNDLYFQADEVIHELKLALKGEQEYFQKIKDKHLSPHELSNNKPNLSPSNQGGRRSFSTFSSQIDPCKKTIPTACNFVDKFTTTGSHADVKTR